MADDKKKKKSKSGISATKAGGYAAQKKYHATNDPQKEREWRERSRERQRGKVYEPKIRVQIEFKPALIQLVADTGMSLTTLCLTALEEKYNITLQKGVDNDAK